MNKPVRVLHVFDALDAGGVENFVMNVYREIDRSRIQFDFALTSGQKALYDEEVIALGGRIFYLDQTKSIRENLRELLRTESFQVIHSHVFFYSGMVLREARSAGIPVRIAHAHNAFTGEKRSVPRAAYELAMRNMIRCHATHMLGCSKKACRYVFGNRSLKDPRVQVFPDGIDCRRFSFNGLVREAIRRELGVEDRFVIGHVGHFTAAKNHEKILKVFAEVCKRRSDALLLLVGDGELEADVRERTIQLGLQDKVIFAGVQSDVERYYQAMDVFLFPSQYEGFGMAMIEAQANGLSCVTSTVVPEETNTSGRCVFLDLTEDDKLWADAVLSCPPRDESDRSYIAVKALYDVGTAARNLSRIYLREKEE